MANSTMVTRSPRGRQWILLPLAFLYLLELQLVSSQEITGTYKYQDGQTPGGLPGVLHQLLYRYVRYFSWAAL